jgi:hypothetical protein
MESGLKFSESAHLFLRSLIDGVSYISNCAAFLNSSSQLPFGISGHVSDVIFYMSLMPEVLHVIFCIKSYNKRVACHLLFTALTLAASH